ncbi:hypothetical protein BDZ45DRAFT_502285 [Acephala macrosclerotiorum]|nr:hypothetical protein BDZ45DRAFT_502285 [Acephala macrosclerotiorum]
MTREKQFKSKLKAWKFEKNVSTSEMQFMIRKRHDRKEIGKPTVFRMSGQIVDEDKIERFARKHSVYEVAAREKTPENIQYDTPEELEEDEERIATAGTPPHLDHSTSLSRPGQRQAAITSYGSNAIPSTNMVSSNAMTANAKRPNFAEILPNPLVNNGNSEYIGPGQLHCFASPGIECYCVSCVAARDKDFTSELLPTLAGLSPNKRHNLISQVAHLTVHTTIFWLPLPAAHLLLPPKLHVKSGARILENLLVGTLLASPPHLRLQQ